MTEITNYHLGFLEDAKRSFIENPMQETYRNDEETLIALRCGFTRDSILVYELGYRVAYFAQQIEPMPIEKKLKQEEF